jgi:hypothetical protein
VIEHRDRVRERRDGRREMRAAQHLQDQAAVLMRDREACITRRPRGRCKMALKAMITTYHQAGIGPLRWPRLAGSWPGVTFTGPPLRLPAGQFRLGPGAGAHAPDEYWLIESAEPEGCRDGWRRRIVRGSVLRVRDRMTRGPLIGGNVPLDVLAKVVDKYIRMSKG